MRQITDDDVHTKLEVLCEIMKRIEIDVQDVKQKVTTQNGNVARIKEWMAVHEEQAQARSRHISNNEACISGLKLDLQPVLALVRYPLVFGIGITVLFISSLAGIYTTIQGIL